MKKFLIFKKLEDGSYAEKLGSYESEFKDDSSANRSYLMAEPMASHFELPEGLDEDCVDLIYVEATPGSPAEEREDGYLPAVDPTEAYWHLVLNEQKVADKAAAEQAAQLDRVLTNAINFGMQIMKDFTKENMVLGITQDGMTGTVRKAMIEVISALQTGSLYDAIAEAKAIPQESKDAKYITDARLLSFVNKIEEYLGIELSQSL
jgi:hypothetical protein